ncbi:MAG: hypothetical protein M5U25_19275 [Planctomycetota bacterium]|nr:hypothetical protein [Planctomycetota bacterium]
MKKAHVWLALCLLLALATFGDSPSAQLAPSNDAMAGAGLVEAAESARDALSTADYKALYNLLDAGARGQIALCHEKFVQHVDASEMTDEQAKNFAEAHDPGGHFGVTSVTQLRNLTEIQFLGMVSGLLAVQSERSAETLSLRWHLTNRSVGLMQPASRMLRKMDMIPWGGAVIFQNRADESLMLVFALEGSVWKLTYFRMDTEQGDLDFEDIAKLSGNWDSDLYRFTSVQRARMAEGEQLMGAARDYSRVHYAKTGEVDAVAKKFPEFIEGGDLAGKYYHVKVLHTDMGECDYDAAIETHPQIDGDAWGLLLFDWASGGAHFEWFESKTELDARIKDLKDNGGPHDGSADGPKAK